MPVKYSSFDTKEQTAGNNLPGSIGDYRNFPVQETINNSLIRYPAPPDRIQMILQSFYKLSNFHNYTSPIRLLLKPQA